MSKIYFDKLTGAGNDFIIIDEQKNPSLCLNNEIIKKLCDRKFGIGADGLIIISKDDHYNFRMQYFNSNGFKGSLCGNGSRCAIWYSKLSGLVKDPEVKFICENEFYRGEIIENEIIKFYLNDPFDIRLNFDIELENQILKASFINTGSPHLVINIHDVFKKRNDTIHYYKNLSELPVIKLGRELRYHKEFGSEGTNVNFFQSNNQEIEIRTYERGVEDETLACGTGAVAVALINYFQRDISPPIKIKTWGGDTLIVNFDVENKRLSNLSLVGPAKLVFTGIIEI